MRSQQRFNIVKHARATEVKISVEKIEESIRVTIRDNGTGFRPETLRSRKTGGFGLFSSGERMTHLGGSMKIESEPGKGTAVVLSLPPAPCTETKPGRESEQGDTVNEKDKDSACG